MTREYRSEVLIKRCLILLAILYLFSSCDIALSRTTSDNHYLVAEVTKGDTIWSLAAQHCGSGTDIRDMVSSIRELNGLGKDAKIVPGQSLKIPTVGRQQLRFAQTSSSEK